MNKAISSFIFFLIFIFASGKAMSIEKYWDSAESSTYADFENSKKMGNKALFWIIVDYHAKQLNAAGQEFQSAKLLYEIDCENKFRKVLQIFMYSLPMAKGSVVYSSVSVNDPGGAVPDKGKVGHRTWELACSLKEASRN